MVLVWCAAFLLGNLHGPARQLPGRPVEPGRVEVLRDVVYGSGGGRPLRMHILRPVPLPREPLPVIVWVHGGGWRVGSRDEGLRFLPAWADRGYLCASVEYRFSQEARFPAPLEDCKCAVRFLRAHAQELHLDPERIGAWGASAGGNMVALLGTTAGVKELEGTGGWPEQSSRVQAVCDWFGPTDFLKMHLYPSRVNHDSPNSAESLLIGGAIQQHKDLVERANPITYIGRRVPPFLIMHGDRDRTVPINQSELLADALKEAGAEVQLYVVWGAGHGFGGPLLDAEVAAFFARHLRPAGEHHAGR